MYARPSPSATDPAAALRQSEVLRPMAASTRIRPGSAMLRLMSLMHDLLVLRRQRHRLALLDERMLRDIGISGADARKEAARPMWNPPLHWRNQRDRRS